MSREGLRFLLIQARRLEDPVRAEEREAFAERLGVGVEQLRAVDMTRDELHMGLLDGVHAVLVGGSGHYSVLDEHPGIRRGVDFLGELAGRGFPTFASCFGFQALVMALGGEVITDEARAEVGTYELSLTPEAAADPVFSTLPPRFLAQEGHRDRASRLPSGVRNLARSERAPYQALKVDGAPVYATQFHPELSQCHQRLRFERYLVEYGALFGEAEALRILESIAPTPETDALLAVFVERVLLGGAG